MRQGFTLIELSIVLVIIGLIVGGVLVGRDLIKAAEVRATITQVEKFNTAVNTFYGKYGYLPGDIPAGPATQFGFAARGPYAGQGDGNGTLEGNATNNPPANYGIVEYAGETVMFWVDLSAAKLIEGGFTAASSTVVPGSTITGAALTGWFPQAKLGGGNYFYTYSFGSGCVSGVSISGNNNLYGLSAISSVPPASYGVPYSTPALTVKQAYDIDTKIDDGFPATGKVLALYLDYNSFAGCGVGYAPNASSASAATCYDTTSKKYSLTQNNGAGANCALSFKMQAGD